MYATDGVKIDQKIEDTVLIIGRKSSGKTSFASALYENLWNSETISVESLTGFNHIDFFKNVAGIKNETWPKSTNNIVESTLMVMYQEIKIQVAVLNCDAKLFTNNPTQYYKSDEVEGFFSLLDRAKAVIILIDPINLLEGDIDSEIDNDYGLIKVVDRIKKSSKKNSIPIVLALTKADKTYSFLKKHGGSVSFVNKYLSKLALSNPNIKICKISVLEQLNVIEPTGNFSTIDMPLEYCLEQILSLNYLETEKEQEKFRKNFITKLKKVEKIKEALKDWVVVAFLLLMLLVLIYLIFRYLPNTIWLNLWFNTAGSFFNIQ